MPDNVFSVTKNKIPIPVTPASSNTNYMLSAPKYSTSTPAGTLRASIDAWMKNYNDTNGTTTTTTTNKPSNPGGTGGTAKGTPGKGGGSGSSSSSANAYIQGLYEQKEAHARAAYDAAMGRLNDAYNKAADNYGNIFNRGVDTLNGSYSNSQNKINNQANDSMREAYVNRMLSEKNLSQKLAAQGLSGGASESAMAGLINNYGNARNNIQKGWNDNLSDLEQTYNSNLNDLYAAYQNQMAQLDNSRANAMNTLEMNLANQIANAQDTWLEAILKNPSLLQGAVTDATANQAAFNPTDVQATNVNNAVNTTQANDMGGTTTNWSRYQEYLKSLQNAGMNNMQVAQNLISQGLSNAEIEKLLNGYYA